MRPQRSGRHTVRDSASRLSGRLLITVRAREALLDSAHEDGPHTLFVSWPGGVTYLPSGSYTPSDYDVIIAHVARFPVYADVRQLALFRDHRAVIDIAHRVRVSRSPVLRMIVTPPVPPAWPATCVPSPPRPSFDGRDATRGVGLSL